MNNLGLNEEKFRNLSCQERCNLLNNNPVLAARYFQHKAEMFFIEMVFDGQLGKTKYYGLRIEFQERGSQHFHSYFLIFNAPNVNDETTCIDFIENTLNAQFPEPENEPELFELAKTYQIHSYSRTF